MNVEGRRLKAEMVVSGKRAYQIAAVAGVSPRKLSDVFSRRLEPSRELTRRHSAGNMGRPLASTSARRDRGRR
jgi:hypothetical protein